MSAALPRGTRAISPDARFLAVCEGDHILMWDLASESMEPSSIRKKYGLFDTVNKLQNPVFSGDGSRLAVSRGSEVYTWDTATLREVVRPLKHPGGSVVSSLSFSPDGGRIATYYRSPDSKKEGVLVWDISAARPESWQVDGKKMPRYPHFALNRCVLTLGRAPGTTGFDLWDVADRKLIGQIASDRLPLLSPDGSVAAVIQGGKIHLWDTATSLKRSPPLADTLAPEGNIGPHPNYLPWQADRTVPEEMTGPVAFSPDWRLMATSTFLPTKSSDMPPASETDFFWQSESPQRAFLHNVPLRQGSVIRLWRSRSV